MPLTPFAGLSVLVHICVIVGHKLFSWVPARKQNVKNTTLPMRFLGFIIIALVFLAVFLNAAILIRASVIDSHSSINYVKNYVGYKVGLSSNLAELALANENVNGENNIYAQFPVSSVGCLKTFEQIVSLYKGSVIEYLSAHNRSSFFEAREELAVLFEIKNYRGTDAQNEILFREIFQKLNNLPIRDSSYCKI